MQHIHNDIVCFGDILHLGLGSHDQEEQGNHQEENVSLLSCLGLANFGVIDFTPSFSNHLKSLHYRLSILCQLCVYIPAGVVHFDLLMETYTLICVIFFFMQWRQTLMVYVNRTFIEPLTRRYGYGTKRGL